MFNITPETRLEGKILESPEFIAGSQHVSIGEGHKEKIVGVHVKQILDYIDRQPWEQYRRKLRTIAFLHDLGKIRVIRNEKGGIVGNSHSQHSEEIARRFITDEDLLYIIRVHDRYASFFREHSAQRFRSDKFVKTYSVADLDVLTRFNYADSNNRDKFSVIWFEDKCLELGLKKDLVYQTEQAR